MGEKLGFECLLVVVVTFYVIQDHSRLNLCISTKKIISPDKRERRD